MSIHLLLRPSIHHSTYKHTHRRISLHTRNTRIHLHVYTHIHICTTHIIEKYILSSYMSFIHQFTPTTQLYTFARTHATEQWHWSYIDGLVSECLMAQKGVLPTNSNMHAWWCQCLDSILPRLQKILSSTRLSCLCLCLFSCVPGSSGMCLCESLSILFLPRPTSDFIYIASVSESVTHEVFVLFSRVCLPMHVFIRLSMPLPVYLSLCLFPRLSTSVYLSVQRRIEIRLL